MAKQKKLVGKEGFETFYSSVYAERWNVLKEALVDEPNYQLFTYNDYSPQNDSKYFLDKASVIAASALPLENAHNILDMCAAPGGKSLIIASRMLEDAKLVCNERSADRRNRLVKNLDEQLPTSVRERICISGLDGALICKKERDVYDAILLDAPCSSERHVFTSPQYLSQWTLGRIKNLSFIQWSLVSSAILLLKKDGYLVYSTCSLAPEENDLIVEKLLKKYPEIKVIDANFSVDNSIILEKTKYGYHILPDKSNGAGPIYFTLVKK